MDERVGVVAVFGAGYVGIPTAILFAEAGWEVRLVEPDERRRAEVEAAMETGADVLGEPGTGAALRDRRDRLRLVHQDYRGELTDAELAVVCVGTPSTGDGLDHAAVESACRAAWQWCASGVAVVVRSTCSPLWVRDFVRDVVAGRPFAVVPEFLREGSALADARDPARLVVGNLVRTEDEDRIEASARIAVSVVGALGSPLARTIFLLPEEAAAAKLASNALLASRVEFALRLASLVEASLPGCNSADIAEAVEADPRIGRGYLRPGLGAGGPCLPKDAALWDALTFRHRSDPRSDVLAPARLALEVRTSTTGSVLGCEVLVWGLGFKPDSVDHRSSPAMRLAQDLAMRGLRVRAWDPRLTAEANVLAVAEGAPLAVAEVRPCPIVVLCTAYGALANLRAWLAVGNVDVWDPYALLSSPEVRSLLDEGARYRGGGRGDGWPCRR